MSVSLPEPTNIKPNYLHIWLYGELLDVNEFQNIHPGGYEVLKDLEGQDATQSFEQVLHQLTFGRTQHSSKTNSKEFSNRLNAC